MDQSTTRVISAVAGLLVEYGRITFHNRHVWNDKTRGTTSNNDENSLSVLSVDGPFKLRASQNRPTGRKQRANDRSESAGACDRHTSEARRNCFVSRQRTQVTAAVALTSGRQTEIVR